MLQELEEEIIHFYDSKFKTKKYGKEAVHLNLSPEHYHRKIIDIVREIKTVKKYNLKILDVGCATGYLGAVLKKFGCEVYGVEISKEAIEEARKVLDEVIWGNIETINLPWEKESFDIIILSDILEHLFHPKKVLLKLKNYLKPEGYFLIVLPNVAHYSIRLMLLRGKWEYKDYGILDYGHLRFFTKDSAKNMIKECGLYIEKIIPYIVLPFPFNKINFILKGKLTKIIGRYFDKLFAITYLFIVKKKE